jgi:predicted DsbA family dithiol-disulfide isomerase
MRIDIWSDVICPWCYLGKRRLERAMAQLEWADEIEIHWRAYLLDPTATAEPQDLASAINRKYGPGAFDGMKKRLGALGAAEGITYRFDTALRVSTLDAHRLLAWAWDSAGAAGQGALKERLLRAYFEDGANVAEAATLARLAGEAGLDAAAAADVVASGAFRDVVLADLEGALDREITGVPGFVVEDRLLIPGAQEPDTFVNVLERARARFGREA